MLCDTWYLVDDRHVRPYTEIRQTKGMPPKGSDVPRGGGMLYYGYPHYIIGIRPIVCPAQGSLEKHTWYLVCII